MRNAVLVGVVAITCLAGTARAQDAGSGGVRSWFSGNVAMASDYSFRGISQTDGKPAIQGGLDLAHPSGLYLGTWGSSVNFGEDLTDGPRAQMELDLYGGFRKSLAGVVDADLGAIYYAYPGAAESRSYDFIEYGLGVSRSFASVGTGVSVKYSPDYFAGSGHATYYGAQVSVPVSLLTLSGSVGHQAIEDNAAFGTPDYTDYGVGVGVGWSGFTVTGKVLSTDLEDEECFAGTDLCHSRLVLSVARSM
jgi:uncharacterized protein (TIGR02001 family)